MVVADLDLEELRKRRAESNISQRRAEVYAKALAGAVEQR